MFALEYSVKTSRPWPARPQVSARAPPVSPSKARTRPHDVHLQVPGKPRDPVAEQFGVDLIQAMTQLRRYALWLSKNASLADDLMQDAVLNAWYAQDRFERGTNLKAWCRTILRNVHVSYLRRSWRMLPLAEETMAALPADGGDFSVALDLLAVRNGITLLPLEQREALLLVGVGGMSYMQAASISGCAVGTVKSRVSRARARLAVLMSENLAGYNSDTGLRAGDAMNDLMQQVASIKRKSEIASRCQGPSRPAKTVDSEAAPGRTAMLSTR
ncbi:MAG: sigma-70 family RNA polymerase sigma factor [Hyphomonas sp.]|nr:sigma-70 family RNA polymerase sigma factor [Hyphomonas sp.]MBU3920796.1 sigma-70 family RNA polymerase sigma factor [Alphaproteobacteria bacterium]MBU4063447.1 sigma-70 family RNA polymerase sigma factor [Alphaproteobacteria bacterium]MBU4165268.1 sigma-70 family RNA polymerase sigma factor [Alphaproteobacteria bacterium]